MKVPIILSLGNSKRPPPTSGNPQLEAFDMWKRKANQIIKARGISGVGLEFYLVARLYRADMGTCNNRFRDGQEPDGRDNEHYVEAALYRPTL